jgi:hypothetical protein
MKGAQDLPSDQIRLYEIAGENREEGRGIE